MFCVYSRSHKKMDTLFDKHISKLYLGNKFDQDLKEKKGETRFPFPYDFYCIQKYLLFTKFIIIISGKLDQSRGYHTGDGNLAC